MELYKNEDFKTERVNGREVEVPEDWVVVKLEKIIEIHNNLRKPIKSDDREFGEYPYCGATGIVDYINKYTADGEYLLIGEDGADWSPKNKDTSYIMKGKFFVNNHVHLLKVKNLNTINFFKNYLNITDLDQKITGSTVRKLTLKNLKSIEFSLPNKEEQTRIATVLTNQDELIESKEKLIIIEEKKKIFLQQEILSGRLRIGLDGKFYKNEDWKTELVNGRETEVPEEWEVKSIKEIAEKTAEGGTPSTKKEEYYEDGNILWATISDISSNMTETKKMITEEGFKNSSTYLWSEGDIVLSTGATIGEVGIVKTPLCTKQGISGIKVKSNFVGKYIFYSIKNNIHILKLMANGSTFLSLTQKALNKIQYAIPNIEEQNRIATVLTKQDEKIETLKKDLEIEKKKQKFLQQELLSGRIRIKETK